MNVVSLFGRLVGEQAATNPEGARKILLAGYAAQQAKLSVAPDHRLPKSRQRIAVDTMKLVRRALDHPETAAATSLFTPTEFLHTAGVTPYSVEVISAFLAGTQCEQYWLRDAEQAGFPETLCSYHRTFLGALESGILPSPKAIVYTNIACDGNMVTFPHAEESFHVPAFFIDVPWEHSEDAVAFVADRLRHLPEFVGDVYGTAPTDDDLSECLAREARCKADYLHYLDRQPTHRLPNDMTSEMYAMIALRVMLGSKLSEDFAAQLARDVDQAPASDGLRLVWMHVIPNMLPPVVSALSFTDRAYIAATDIIVDGLATPIDPAKPYETLARRMVYSAYNGSTDLRIERALDLCRRTHADGVVYFAHWGCKMTLGAAHLAKTAIEVAGYPCLVLDGDGCDRVNTSEGQVATRLNAFLELLEARRAQEEA